MIHDDERAIIEFLALVSENAGYERWVWLYPSALGEGRKAWQFLPTRVGPVAGASLGRLETSADDVASLRNRGYLDGPDPHVTRGTKRYTLTQKGRDLRARGYIEVPDPAPGQYQHNYISGGNVAVAQTGAGAISQVVGPQVDLTLLRDLLAELREVLADSDLPEVERNSYGGAIALIERQLTATAPNMAMIAAAWQYVALIGDGESVLQAGERAIAIFHALLPHIQALLGK